MNIYIMRHGLAAAPGSGGDAQRPLTPEGQRKTRKCARALKRLDLNFDLVLSSHYRRARETAEIVVNTLRQRGRLELVEELTPEGSNRSVLQLLRERAVNDVLLVGHEPGLSQLISLLVSGRDGFQVTMKKSAVCKVSSELLKPGNGSLEWLLTPKQMFLME